MLLKILPLELSFLSQRNKAFFSEVELPFS